MRESGSRCSSIILQAARGSSCFLHIPVVNLRLCLGEEHRGGLAWSQTTGKSFLSWKKSLNSQPHTNRERGEGGWVCACVCARARTDWILSHLNGTEFFLFFFLVINYDFLYTPITLSRRKSSSSKLWIKDWKIEQHSLLHCIRPACFEPHKRRLDCCLSSVFQEVHG